jgi:hypothetical protein
LAVQAVTVQMPAGLYERLKRRADQAHRSIEAEVLETVASAVPPDDSLSSDLEEAVARLTLMDDNALWELVHAHFPTEKSARLSALHWKRQDSGLVQAETQQAAQLAQELEQFMFLRAQAMALLMQRGHELSED